MKKIIAPLSIFLLALLIRFAYLLSLRGTPVTELLLIDSATYERFARLILDGRFRGEEIYSMNILYPWFLAMIHRVVDGVTPVFVVQAILDAATCVMIGRLGAAHFDRRTGLWSGIIAAFYGPFVFYTGALLTPAVINFFCVATLLLLASYAVSRRGRVAFLAGLALGIASLGRGNSVLLVPFAAWWFISLSGPRRIAVRHWAAFAAGAALLLTGVTARNYFVEGKIVPLSANYAAFYIGHNEKSNGLYTLPDFVKSADFEGEVGGTRKAVGRLLGREVTVAESAAYLFRAGWRHMVRHPLDEAFLAMKKFYYFWNDVESGTNLSYYFTRDFSVPLRALPFTFGWLVPFAAAGAVANRREWRHHLILYLHMAVYPATALLFFVSSEYRLPLVPAIIPFAAAGAIGAFGGLGARLRRHRSGTGRLFAFPAATGPLLAFLAAALFCNFRSPLLKAQSLKRVDYLNFGVLYAREGKLDRAVAMFERSLDIDPRFGPAHEALSDIFRRRGDDRRAAAELELARRYRLGGQYTRGGAARYDEATEAMLRAANLYNSGEYAAALKGFTLLHERYRAAEDTVVAQKLLNNIGLCRYKLGEFDEAEEAFETLIEEDPGYAKAYYNLGRVREAEGRRAEALRLYENAFAVEPFYDKARQAWKKLAGKR